MSENKEVLTPEESREWLKACGITQTQVAERCGCSKYVIRNLLNGSAKGNWGDSHIAALALKLKAPAPGETPLSLVPENRRSRAKRSPTAEKTASTN